MEKTFFLNNFPFFINKINKETNCIVPKAEQDLYSNKLYNKITQVIKNGRLVKLIDEADKQNTLKERFIKCESSYINANNKEEQDEDNEDNINLPDKNSNNQSNTNLLTHNKSIAIVKSITILINLMMEPQYELNTEFKNKTIPILLELLKINIIE
jgi:hypothetical protein